MTRKAIEKFAERWLEEMKRRGVPGPDSYTEDELIYLNPEVPPSFTRAAMRHNKED